MHVVDGVEMVDVREAARLASRSPETIRRWVWSGKVQAIKYGTKLLVPRASVAPAAAVETSGAVTLAHWAAEVSALRSGVPGGTASDLVFADRQERSDGAGS